VAGRTGVALRVTVEEPAPAPDDGPADVLVVTIAFEELSGPIPEVPARLNLRVPTWSGEGATVQVNPPHPNPNLYVWSFFHPSEPQPSPKP